MKHSSPTVCGKCGTTFTEYDHDQPGLCLDCWELWDTECWAKSPLGKLEGENAALRAEIKTLRDRVNSEIDDLMRHYHSDEHTLVNVGVQAQRLMSILRGGNDAR